MWKIVIKTCDPRGWNGTTISGRVHDAKNPKAPQRNKCVSRTAGKHACVRACVRVHNSRRHNTIFLPIVCNLCAMLEVTARIFTEYINLGSACRTVLLIFCAQKATYRINSLYETRHFYGAEQIEYTVIPRLTKIIRSGITFVSRNLR